MLSTDITIAGTIGLAGLLGGFGAHLRADTQSQGDSPDTIVAVKRGPIIRPIILGVIAAWCVPLFLTLVHSDLVTNLSKTSADLSFSDLMTLFGFCLIASLYSPEFLDGVSRQLIRRVNQLDSGLRMEKSERKSELKSVEALVNDVAKDIPVEDRPSAGKTILPDDARQVAASVGAVSDLPGDEGSAGDVRAAIRPLTDAIAGLTSDEARTLQVSMYLTKRTATGIAQDAGIPRSKIGEILDHLAEKGLVQRTVSDRTGGARWAITKQGTALLNSADKA